MNKEQLELLRALGSVEENICNCGSCREAAEADIRQYEQLAANQCPIWIWQVGFALMRLGAAGVHEEMGHEAFAAMQAVGPVSIDSAMLTLAQEKERKNAH